MQLMDRVRKSEHLGREFLLWLWWKSETQNGRFEVGEEIVELWFDRRIILESESDEGIEKIVCSGDNPHLREARFALTENKQITEAMVKLVIGDGEWTFSLDSKWMNFKGFKTPKVMLDDDEDPDGLFYEKYFLIDRALSVMDAIYAAFVKRRISPEWKKEEIPALLEWIKEGK
ncbi:MAG: hypothetical protein ACOWYE_02460 [Desulfatiglandales bacterium]